MDSEMRKVLELEMQESIETGDMQHAEEIAELLRMDEMQDTYGAQLEDAIQRTDIPATVTTLKSMGYPISESLYNLGNDMSRNERFDDAVKFYRAAIDYYDVQPGNLPTRASIFNNMGTAYKSDGKYSRAVSCYRSALSDDVTYLRGYIRLAQALVLNRQEDEAIQALRMFLTNGGSVDEVKLYCGVFNPGQQTLGGSEVVDLLQKV